MQKQMKAVVIDAVSIQSNVSCGLNTVNYVSVIDAVSLGIIGAKFPTFPD